MYKRSVDWTLLVAAAGGGTVERKVWKLEAKKGKGGEGLGAGDRAMPKKRIFPSMKKIDSYYYYFLNSLPTKERLLIFPHRLLAYLIWPIHPTT